MPVFTILRNNITWLQILRTPWNKQGVLKLSRPGLYEQSYFYVFDVIIHAFYVQFTFTLFKVCLLLL